METIISKCKPMSSFFLFCLGLALLLPAANANMGDFDEVWMKRAEEARKAALEAYHPDPDDVTDHINTEVHAVMAMNSTRRSLKNYTGPCRATNPIDRCWRCQSNWAKHRSRLAECVLGFGRNTVGGKYGKIYTVTDPSDDNLVNPKNGTLRYGVIQSEPLWIIFERPMIIRLQQELIMNNLKTIDARGANVHIAYGSGITVQFIKQIIIHGLHIHHVVPGFGGIISSSPTHAGNRTTSDGDGVSIYGSTHVWVDHLSMSNCTDGLIDIIEGSTAITLSNNHFTHHNEVMLMGASDDHSDDKVMQVTVAFNHFGTGLFQRMPRCRWGFFHVLNNDYTHWLNYAVGGSQNPTIISQGNRFIATQNATEVTKRFYADQSEWKNWIWKSEGDLFMNNAVFVQSGPERNKKQFSKADFVTAKPGKYVSRLTRFAGPLKCIPGNAC